MATTFAGGARRAGLFDRLRESFDLRYYAVFVVAVTYGLIVLGGTVRSTDSGEACPDWPLCHGQVIPPADVNVWIEFTHRLVASIVGFLILALVVAIWRTRPGDRPIRYAAIGAIALLALQVIVGGITVGTETAAGIVAIHLSIALSLISTLIFMTVRLFTEDNGRAPAPVDVLPVVVAAGVFALVITGAFLAQDEGAGLAYRDWPLFNGGLTPSGSADGQLHYGHRLVAGAAGLLMAGLFIQGLRAGVTGPALWGLTAATLLFVAQTLLGAANVWLELHTSVRILHLALASAVWAVLVFTIVWAQQQGQRLTKGTG